MSAEIQCFYWYFFFPRTSQHVLVHISLICCHCMPMSPFPSSRRSCRDSYLFLIVCRKDSVVTLSFRKSTLYCVLVLLLTSLFFRSIFILASTKWWFEATYAPVESHPALIFRTYVLCKYGRFDFLFCGPVIPRLPCESCDAGTRCLR